jgi:hypothetical protein
MKLVITIDTEGDNQWAAAATQSVENLRFVPRFQDLCDRFTFKPTYLCTYDVATAAAFDEIFVPYERSGRAEIGAHLHPWSTPPFEPAWDASATGQAYPSELPPGLFARKLERLTAILHERTGRPPRSYRAGRWGLSAAHVPYLIRFGYVVDCSVTPLVDWRDLGARDRGQDFSRAPVRPYFMAWGDPAREGTSGLLEVPVTILLTNGLMRRSAVLRSWYRRWRKTTAARVLNRVFRVAPQWFRPFADMTPARLAAVHDTARRLGLPVVEMMFHSSELMPGGSPHSTTAADVERLYERLDQIFTYLADRRVEGVTLSAFADEYRRQQIEGGAAATPVCSADDLTWSPAGADPGSSRCESG